MKQYEAVIKVMEENGGFATLSYLYENALKVPWSYLENQDTFCNYS
jgi:hypothetical protein